MEKVALWAEELSEAPHSIGSLAKKLGLGADIEKAELALIYSNNNYSLMDLKTRKTALEINYQDSNFQKKLKQHSPHSHPLKKSLGHPLDGKSIFDGTAGRREDALLMASWNCEVVACEKNPLMYFLAEESWKKVQNEEFFQKLRVQFTQKDSFDFLSEEKQHKRFEVIYLDPMYPKTKKAALPGKALQSMRLFLEAQEESFQKLFELSLKKSQKKVILKRPPKSGYYLDKKPVHLYESARARYDVYLS